MTKSDAENTGRKERPKLPAKPQGVRGRPFAKGESGNPSGRPVGSLNASSRAAAALFEGEAEAIGRKAVELAKAGDVQAIRLILERLVPPMRERALAIDLPKLTSAQELPAAVSRLLALVAEGAITPTEGERLAALLGAWREAVELAEFEERISALEERS
jgi:hypothetical protein